MTTSETLLQPVKDFIEQQVAVLAKWEQDNAALIQQLAAATAQIATLTAAAQQPAPTPSEAEKMAQRVIEAAHVMDYLNIQYKFGGEWENDGAFDCSAYQQCIFGYVGIKLPRTALEQSKAGKPVTGELKPADLLFFKLTSRDAAVDHVGMYIGDGLMIHTNNTANDINIASITSGVYLTKRVTERRFINW
jgi:cell wall-associated NlpC family hydrolase